MSYRDSAQEVDSPAATQPDFPVAHNFLENIHSNRELRREARHERKLQAQMARARRHHETPQDNDRAEPQPGQRQPGDRVSYPAQGPRPAPYAPDRPPLPGYPPAPVQNYYKIPQAVPRTYPGQERSEPEINPEPANRRLLPDGVGIKELDGSLQVLDEAAGKSADERLSGYLNSRGKQLVDLDLDGSSVTDTGLSLLNKAPHLSKLWLNDTAINNDSMKVLAAQNLQKLKDLNLSSTRVADEGVIQLQGLPLKVLNISDTATSDDCMQGIKNMKDLQVLYADYSGIGDRGIKSFQEMPNLRAVSLKGCPLTDEAVADLARCQNLMLLNLEDTRLSPDRVQWLQQHMPRCLVISPESQQVPAEPQPMPPSITEALPQPRHEGFFKRLFGIAER